MRYDESYNRIVITVTEMVSISRRCIAPTLPSDDEEPGAGSADLAVGEELSVSFTAGGNDYLLVGRPRSISGDGLTVLRRVESVPSRPRRAEEAQIRGEAFLLGYMLAVRDSLQGAELTVVYRNDRLGQEHKTDERVERKRLTAFFNKCVSALAIFAAPQAERVSLRLPSLKRVTFPYPSVREGQADFIRACYRALSTGARLVAGAPTGTGKTVSVLYPALRAIGEGRIEKAFYLTPKTTTQMAAKDCLELFAAKGAKVRAIILSAKDKLCRRGRICRTDRRACPGSKMNRLPDGVMELFNLSRAVVTENDIEMIAEKFSICPHELALTYSELCDVVICDVNYLFDPTAYIRRFFAEGGEYAFLVDEAHNLPDRIREAYSAELGEEDLVNIEQSPLVGVMSRLKQNAPLWRSRLTDILYPLVREELREDKEGGLIGAQSLSEIPTELYGLISDIEEAADEEMTSVLYAKDEEAPARVRFYRDFLNKIRSFSEAVADFDKGYRLLVFHRGGSTRASLYLIDPGSIIAGRTAKGRSAIFFSATLQPMSYYSALLGIDGSDKQLAVPSPFDSDSVSVSIMDKISTRYSERERTLPAVSTAIAATLSGRRGNYMVFAPSYEYAEALFECFRQKYPRIKAMLQTKDMTKREREEFLTAFAKGGEEYLLGFCVLGGIYSEGVDLVGDSLIGAVIVGIGMPGLCYERERMAEYFESKFEQGKEFAYVYPGMNKVFQAAGRVIRTEEDRGVIVLIDDRFADPIYKKSIPDLWRSMRYVENSQALSRRLKEFWARVDKESAQNTKKNDV